MARLFGIIPYGGDSVAGQFVKDVGYAGEGFMGSAVAASQDMDEREANIADMVTKATLSSALELDSKYPAFRNAEQERVDKYKLLRDDPAIGPEKAKYFFYAPGFLEQENWLKEAHAWSRSSPDNFKWTGMEEPEETYQKNISKFQSTVKGQLSGTMGENMTNLFVGKDQSLEQPDIGQKTIMDDEPRIGNTTQETGTEERVGMMPPLDTSQTTAEMKANVWRKVLGGYENGMSPIQMFNGGLLNEGELKIWDNTTGQDKLKADAITTAMSIDEDYQAALNSGNSEALIQATANLQNKVNMLYNLNRTLALEDDKNIPNVELNNKTYKPSKNENGKIMETFPEDGSKVIYSEGDGDDTKFYIKQGNVMLEIIPDEASKKGYAIEGSPRYKELTNKDTNFWGLPKGQYPLL